MSDIPENDYTIDTSNSECHVPLSPVLGSGQSIRKFRKSRKHHNKGSKKVAQKLEDALKPKDTEDNTCENIVRQKECLSIEDNILKDFNLLEDSIINQEVISGSSSAITKEPLSVLDRIKKLESLELHRSNIVKSISFKTTNVILEAKKMPLAIVECSDIDSITKAEEFNEFTCKNHSVNISEPLPTGPIGFQTGRGKNINISDNIVKKSKKLFEDILYPHSSQTSRTKKYNYLHKNVCEKPDDHTNLQTISVIPKSELENSNANSIFPKDEALGLIISENENPSSKIEKSLNFGTESNRKPERKPILFNCKNFEDVNLNEPMDFKSTSPTFVYKVHNQKTVCNQETPVKCVSEVDFNSLETKEFKNALLNEGKPKIVKNIFDGTNFDDLNMGQNIGFKSASRTLGQTVKQLNHASVSSEHQSSYVKSKNIFDNENFDDLNLGQSIAFKSTSVTLGQTVEQPNPCSDSLKYKLPPVKPQNIFEGEIFNDFNIGQNIGFKSASTTSGQTMEQLNRLSVTAKDTLPKVKQKNIFDGENFDDLNIGQNIGFVSASRNVGLTKPINNLEGFKLNSDKKALELANNDDTINSFQGFKTTAEHKATAVRPSVQPKKSFKHIFGDENFDDLNVNFDQFKTASRNEKVSIQTVKNVKTKPGGFKNIFEGENFDDLSLAGLGAKFQGFVSSKPNILSVNPPGNFQSPFKTPVKNTIPDRRNLNSTEDNFEGFECEEQETSLNISNEYNQIISKIDGYESIAFKPISKMPPLDITVIENLARTLQKSQHRILSDYETDIASRKRKFSEVDSDHNSLCQSAVTPLQRTFLKKSKKRLGCHFSPTIQVSETGLKRAKLMFDDLEPKTIETSTPIKFAGSLGAKPLFCDLTPIQGVRKNLGSSFLNTSVARPVQDRSSVLNLTLVGPSNKYSLNKPSNCDVRLWLDNLGHERRILEERLRILDEKQTILVNQRNILAFSGGSRQRIVPGVLYKSKSVQCRVSLQDYVGHSFPGKSPSDIAFLNQINPQNAHLVHFYICDKRISHVKTEDGAVIVPNTDNRIGISEIEHSFKLIDGVDRNLIHKGWVLNHYKWIVWKLASYERMFADKFEGCLSVENVVQQLKYRYDVEIDNVKRPALRKIFEKDDCPQKRMILCVSKIVKLNNSHELELTDGWYPIRTVIDSALTDQIVKGKIKLGVKLIIYGAEIINCEGCHPLEATDLIYLKINYNSTRIALWSSKLGYQSHVGPFLVSLGSINMDGGRVGCIKCFVVRLYPVKFMEKCGDTNIWRNRKAEERREQDFYNERSFQTSDTHHHSWSNKNGAEFINYKDIKNIEDPDILYDFLQKSGDPESFQEMLSASQRTILYNYTINKPTSFNRIPKNTTSRCVTSLLKLKIVDASWDSDKVHEFHVWKPGEGHLQELKEGEIVTVFNVSCNSKWGLSANQSTQYRREGKPTDERFQKFRRKVTDIRDLQGFLRQDKVLNEFDTVGLVITKQTGDIQKVWMADGNKKLLAIRIYDSPKNILALDTVNEGQIVSVCNLVIKHADDKHVFAVAEHSVVFARYSQHTHLQDALEKMEVTFQNVNRQIFMQECQNKIMQIESQWEVRNPTMDFDVMDGMECSQITITDMALLDCVDKLI